MNNQLNPNRAISTSYGFKIICVVAGVIVIYLGYDLFIRGVSGSASLSINTKTIGGQLLNASPGLFFAIIGAAIAIVGIIRPIEIQSSTKTPHRVCDVQFANADEEDDHADTKT